MPTKTSPKPDPAKELERLEAVLLAAKQEENAVRQRIHEHDGRIHGLRAQLLNRSIEHREEFADDGSPKPGTAAADLAATIHEEASKPDFQAALHGAQGRVELARQAAVGFRERQARELLLGIKAEAEQAGEEFTRWAAEGPGKLGALSELSHRASTICTQSRAYDPRRIPGLDHWSNLVKQLTRSEPPLPLPIDLVLELNAEEEQGE